MSIKMTKRNGKSAEKHHTMVYRRPPTEQRLTASQKDWMFSRCAKGISEELIFFTDLADTRFTCDGAHVA